MAESNENEIFEVEAHDINPLIFYRITKPLQVGKSLPYLDLENYFKRTELYGITVEADPDYAFQKNDVIISLEYDSYERIQNRIKNFDEKFDEELLEHIENNLTAMQQNFLECPYVFLMAAEVEFKDPKLRTLPTESVQSRIDSLVMFNQYLLKSLPFLYFDEKVIYDDSEGAYQLQRENLTSSFILGKKYALDSVKKSYLKTVSDTLQASYNQFSITLNKEDIKKRYNEGIPDSRGDFTAFGQLFKKSKEAKFENLRFNDVTSSGWNVSFTQYGETNVGTFRRSLSWIIEELHSNMLPLFIPSTNNRTKTGPNQDGYVINPACKTPLHLEWYKFLGALIGMCFRSGHCLDLKLTPLFWKKFLFEPLQLEDLEGIDQKLYETLKNLKDKAEGKPSSAPTNMQKLSFVAKLSDGTEVHLKENGDEEMVDDHNAQEYITAVLKARFSESQKQIQAISEGFNIIYPSEVARILYWEDIRSRICGHEVNIKKLKEKTSYYNGGETYEQGQMLWNVLGSFTPEQLSKYYRAVYGVSRMAHESKNSNLTQYVNVKQQYEHTNHDDADVTFQPGSYQITLPKYTTEEVMKTKILKAIEEMDKYMLRGKGESNEEVKQEEQLRRPPPRTRSSLSSFEGSMPSSTNVLERRDPLGNNDESGESSSDDDGQRERLVRNRNVDDSDESDESFSDY